MRVALDVSEATPRADGAECGARDGAESGVTGGPGEVAAE